MGTNRKLNKFKVKMLRKIPSLSSMQQMMRPVSSTSSTSSLNQLGKQSAGTMQRVPSEPKSFGFAAEVKKTHCEKVERQFIGFFGQVAIFGNSKCLSVTPYFPISKNFFHAKK